jgi:hypothetical protein
MFEIFRVEPFFLKISEKNASISKSTIIKKVYKMVLINNILSANLLLESSFPLHKLL